tara:strand:- start:302 stop:844 length:543 start_codon:yes stop_codon:yes gene_type:complete
MIKNARLSFPDIWTPKAFFEGQAPKFSCSLLLDKELHKAQIVSFKKTIKEAALAGFNGVIPAGLKICLNDGNEKSYDGYENAMYIRCASRLRPQIIDRDRTPLVEEDGRPYAGCYVNAAVSLWIQDHNLGGKRVACNINALQFVKDGETFGAGGIKTETVFDDISSEQDADVEAEDDFLS